MINNELTLFGVVVVKMLSISEYMSLLDLLLVKRKRTMHVRKYSLFNYRYPSTSEKICGQRDVLERNVHNRIIAIITNHCHSTTSRSAHQLSHCFEVNFLFEHISRDARASVCVTSRVASQNGAKVQF